MAALSATIYSQSHKKVSEIDLPKSIFSLPAKRGLVHEIVRQQLAGMRSGTHSTKSKGLVRGGGKKPFKQKGTGNARQGSSRSPLLVGGGVAFGPKPRDYSYSVPKKKKWGAVAVLLSNRLKEGKFHVVDKLDFKDGKTKDLVETLKLFKINSGLIIDLKNDQLERATRNLEKVKYLHIDGINPYDIISHEDILITKGGVAKLFVREKSND